MNKDNKRLIRVGVDGNEANLENRVGVNTYAYETLNAISRLEKEWKDEVLFEIVLKDSPKDHMPKETESFKYVVLPGGGMWIIKTLTPYLIKHKRKFDVFWTPSHYVPLISFASRVCSVMDLGYIQFKNQFKSYDYWQLKIWTHFSLFVSKKILAISQATKNDIEKNYPFTKGKITTTLLGYDQKRYNTEIKSSEVKRIKEKFNIPGEYILFLSTLKPSKNVEGLLRAWSHISNDFEDYKLVIAGKKGWLFEDIFNLTKELGLENKVIFTDFFDEKEKPALISGAKAFILPSFWEGFGLDVVSSMACGVPVIISNKGSLPEVAGEAGIVVNPDDSDDIASAISKILKMNKDEYVRLSKLGIKRAKDFNWEKTALQTINVLKSVI